MTLPLVPIKNWSHKILQRWYFYQYMSYTLNFIRVYNLFFSFGKLLLFWANFCNDGGTKKPTSHLQSLPSENFKIYISLVVEKTLVHMYVANFFRVGYAYLHNFKFASNIERNFINYSLRFDDMYIWTISQAIMIFSKTCFNWNLDWQAMGLLSICYLYRKYPDNKTLGNITLHSINRYKWLVC